MMTLKKTFFAFLFLTLFSQSSPALAFDCGGECDKAEKKSSCEDKKDSSCCKKKYKKKRIAFDLSYASTPNPKYSPAFRNGGFENPKSQNLQFGLTFYKVKESKYARGFSLHVHSSSRGAGDYGARFSNFYTGFLLGKSLLSSERFEIIPYVLLGMGSNKTEVYARGFAGNYSELYFVGEPTILFNLQTTRFLKIGAVAAFNLPFGHIETFKRGDALGVSNVAKLFWRAGLQLTFGRFN
jgi:hypothetical protein